jgi:hypothetical protein
MVKGTAMGVCTGAIGAVAFVMGTATAQDAADLESRAYASCEHGFAIIFPGEPMAREVCRRLLAEIVSDRRCDFVTGFALRYPTEVFLTMIGCPAADADRFVPWVEDFFHGFGGDAAGDTLTSIESLYGSNHADALFGNAEQQAYVANMRKVAAAPPVGTSLALGRSVRMKSIASYWLDDPFLS